MRCLIFIQVDLSGNPSVVYEDAANSSKATVMYWNGSAWSPVGSAGFSAGVAGYTSIGVNSSGTIYTVHSDSGLGSLAVVRRYDP